MKTRITGGDGKTVGERERERERERDLSPKEWKNHENEKSE
jgi:hypothetical protein